MESGTGSQTGLAGTVAANAALHGAHSRCVYNSPRARHTQSHRQAPCLLLVRFIFVDIDCEHRVCVCVHTHILTHVNTLASLGERGRDTA